MGAYEGLSKYFANGVLHKAHELGYGEFLISILKGDEEILEQKYNSVWNELKKCKYHIEDKTPIDFGRDMISTWMFEDCVIGTLKKSGLDITYGKDYVNRKKFTTRPDTLNNSVFINTPTQTFSLIIRSDYTGAWTKTGTLVLRESQYKKLKNKNMILLGLSTIDDKLIILNHTSLSKIRHIESYEPYNNKSVYEIDIPESSICEFNKTNIVKEIKNYCLYK